ncbi:uncharacterized protein J3D65DRAFT_684185 [Phyllosticta citribraziliensis]|uniref:Zn(2)-C6 fungal-type domain-containing protein n=1 Tax=Phyllosticta citribraziliensis TaxID=989973 RepID=A0ABR1LC70_9PEZI
MAPPNKPPIKPKPGLKKEDMIGHPFKAVSSYDNAHLSGRSQIVIEEGDVGYIRDYDPRQNMFVLYNPNQPKETSQGWVPGQFIVVGQEPWSAFNVSIDGGFEIPYFTVDASSSSSTGDELFTSTARAWTLAIHQQKDASLSTVVPDWWHSLVRPQAEGVGALITLMKKGVRDARLLETFNKPNFTCQDILNRCKTVTPTSHGSVGGIYLRLYWEVEGYPADMFWLYVGRCTTFSSRFKTHHQSIFVDKDESFHYDIARKAKKFRMLPLCHLPKDASATNLDLFVEQLFVCLLETYRFQNVAQENIGQATHHSGKWYFPGRVLMAFTKSVQERQPSNLTWPGACHRTSFGRTPGIGLNISSPFMEAGLDYQQSLWYRTKVMDQTYGEVTIFTSGPSHTIQKKEMRKEGESWKRVTADWVFRGRRASGETVTVTIQFDATKFPKEQTLAQLVLVFLTPDPADPYRRHPRSWVRLPTVGPFKDWNLAGLFACRLEWQDEAGNWMCQYAQRECRFTNVEPATSMDEKGAGSLRDYVAAMSLYHFFHRVAPSNPRSWDSLLGLCRFRDITTDLFNRTFIFSKERGGVGVCPDQSAKSEHALVAELKAAGLHNINTGWRITLNDDRQRERCDTCLEDNHGVCKRSRNGRNCVICEGVLKRPCTWTHSGILRENDAAGKRKREALRGPEPHPQSYINLLMTSPEKLQWTGAEVIPAAALPPHPSSSMQQGTTVDQDLAQGMERLQSPRSARATPATSTGQSQTAYSSAQPAQPTAFKRGHKRDPTRTELEGATARRLFLICPLALSITLLVASSVV